MASAKWNLLIYANADGVVSQAAMRAAITAMSAAPLPSECHIAVQFNTADAMERHWISNGQHQTETAAPVNTSRRVELTKFIDAATHKFGRQPTMLILAAHGSGLDDIRSYLDARALGGPLPAAPEFLFILGSEQRWGPDPVSGEFLTNIAIKEAITSSTLQRVDLLGFNACWMQMLEIGFELRDITDTLVGCQVFAQLWPYGEVVSRLAADTTQSPESWARQIVSAVRSDIGSGLRDDAVSAFRTGQRLTDLANAVDTFADRAISLIDTKWAAMSNAINNSPRGIDDPLAADLSLIVTAATCGDQLAQQAASAVRDVLTAARIDQVAHGSHPHVQGLNIFCPRDVTIDLAVAYSGLEFRTNRWAAFLKKFQARQAADLLGPNHHFVPGHFPAAPHLGH